MDDEKTETRFSRVMHLLQNFGYDVATSPLNLALFVICIVLLIKIFRMRTREEPVRPILQKIPKLRKDLTVDELKDYNGSESNERVLVAVNGKIFDVTYNGRTFYGPGGPYSVFAGRDASRALATFSLEVSALRDGYDDLSDLGTQQMESLKEWELQFTEKYDYVGKLLKPGESPNHYSDDEDLEDRRSSPTKPKDQYYFA